jgi:hypothetical protein
MKAANKIVLLLLGLRAIPAVFAGTPDEESYLASCRKDPQVPVPIAVVAPVVGPAYNGATVQLEFLVDVDGKPSDFVVRFAPDDILAKQVLDAVKKWRFQPAEFDGKRVPKRVALPVNIVDPAFAGTRYASK